MEADNLKETQNSIEKQAHLLESAGLKVKVTITASTVEMIIEPPNSSNLMILTEHSNPPNPPNPKR